VVRTDGNPAVLTRPVREAIRAVDPALPVDRVRTLEEVVARSTARESFTLLLLGIAAALALLLGGVGIYGVVAYIVSQRTQEIGVRMALGARRTDISLLVLRDGLVLALAGVGVGLAAAFAFTRPMASLLFEVSPTDPATFATVPLFLALVTLLASWLPAHRAAAVTPSEALRNE
jgi:putative ABC transport system permease protein